MKTLILVALALGSAAHGADPSDYAAVIANPARSAADRERDARDHPADILALAGVRRGMTVADLFGAGGYWSELLSDAVGPKGSVLLVNNKPYEELGKEDLATRFANGRLPNVKRLIVDPEHMNLGRSKLDAALIVISYHDLYWVDEKEGWPKLDAGRFLDQVHAALRPGGTFVIVDHAAQPGTGTSVVNALHRIDEEFTKKDLASHGFRLEKTWDGLRNPADDRTKRIFDPAIRGHTDRFVHVYRKS